jgi:Family of unknown function (DUF6152)
MPAGLHPEARKLASMRGAKRCSNVCRERARNGSKRHEWLMRRAEKKRVSSDLVRIKGRSITMRKHLLTMSLVAATGISGGAVAHHGWGSYDASKTMTIESSITHLEWQNPHVHIAVNHNGGTWALVLAPPFRMEARGLSPDLMKVGTQVRAVGYPSTRVERELRAERIVVGGKTYELR